MTDHTVVIFALFCIVSFPVSRCILFCLFGAPVCSMLRFLFVVLVSTVVPSALSASIYDVAVGIEILDLCIFLLFC